eukprot:TRINITY_DN22726_c0_g1_i1.p1 TRINITY_DN22726_c0_g1~~TRINITY_DN22726_c0_g1_i1.p1  ORF type:complete len:275 (-),score=61.75 TRINITY_DN22726_c0_g1_i1:159-956(-)
MTGEEAPKKPPPPGAKRCPIGWEGPKEGGCCIRRWSLPCNEACSRIDCNESPGGWEFRWADFRNSPFTCCPKAEEDPLAHHIGGQPLCPEGWRVEFQDAGHCCRKSFSWACGEKCAEDQCKKDVGMAWHPTDKKGNEDYKCCAEGLLVEALKPSEKPSEASSTKGLSLEASKPMEKLPDTSWLMGMSVEAVKPIGKPSKASSMKEPSTSAKESESKSHVDKFKHFLPFELSSSSVAVGGLVVFILFSQLCMARKSHPAGIRSKEK